MTTWTPERKTRLKDFVVAGWSGSEIANILGVTRNAVIGAIYRMGLTGCRPHKPPPPERPKPTGWKRWRSPRNGLKNKTAPIVATVVPEQSESLWLSLHDLEAKHCRWPSSNPINGSYRFCGCQKIDGSSYCAYHLEIGMVKISNKSSDILKKLQEGGVPR